MKSLHSASWSLISLQCELLNVVGCSPLICGCHPNRLFVSVLVNINSSEEWISSPTTKPVVSMGVTWFYPDVFGMALWLFLCLFLSSVCGRHKVLVPKSSKMNASLKNIQVNLFLFFSVCQHPFYWSRWNDHNCEILMALRILKKQKNVQHCKNDTYFEQRF